MIYLIVQRNRFAIIRNNRTEIWGGLHQAFKFYPIEKAQTCQLKTYATQTMAEYAKQFIRESDCEVVPIVETVEIESEE